MIDLYFNFYKKNFNKKLLRLLLDIEKIFSINNIVALQARNKYLDSIYEEHLTSETWGKANNVFATLDSLEEGRYCLLDKFKPKTIKKNDDQALFIDLFAGAGGLSYGLEEAGFQQAFTNELIPEFLETYFLNRNTSLDSIATGDIKQISNNTITNLKQSNIQLLVGGPPCQGFSNANRQRLIDDPRNHLYRYFVELIKEVQPRIFLMENVRGMLNKSEEIMQDFSTNLKNYKTTIFMLNAKEFGVPQHRERVFILGTNDKNLNVNEIRDELLNTKEEDFIPISQALEFLPKLGNKEQKSAYIENDNSGYKFTNKLAWSSIGNEYLDKINQGRDISILSNHMNRYNNPRDIEIFSKLPQGKDSTHPSIEEIMPYKSRTGAFKDKYFKLREDHVSKTITAHMDKDCNSYIHPNQSRGLSPREAARIQSFPDDYIFMGPKNKWYTQIGNAVPPLLAKHIGTTIKKYIS
jgi:DNA (cytosine-5)-methyltransferase 1